MRSNILSRAYPARYLTDQQCRISHGGEKIGEKYQVRQLVFLGFGNAEWILIVENHVH